MMKKRAISLLLIVAMLVALGTPAFATPYYPDFPEDAIVFEVFSVEEFFALFDQLEQEALSRRDCPESDCFDYDYIIYMGHLSQCEIYEIVYGLESRGVPALFFVLWRAAGFFQTMYKVTGGASGMVMLFHTAPRRYIDIGIARWRAGQRGTIHYRPARPTF